MYIIGDVHGKYKQYKTLLKGKQNSIAVGDMGVGFVRTHGAMEGESHTNPPYDFMKNGNHRFIRGNHDNSGVCRKHTQCIKDGTFENGVFYCGGAFSVDKAYRTEHFNWWSDEELSYDEADKALSVYLESKPEVVVTHDAPVEVVNRIHTSHHRFDDSFTQRYLQNMFEQHQPKYWFFGHHHVSWSETVNGTIFRCLNELEMIEL